MTASHERQRAGLFLSLGQCTDREFAALWHRVQEWTAPAIWRCRESCEAFLCDRPAAPIEWAVIWQCWSDEYTSADIAKLLAALPLCRVVCITGPWCEADQRTRRVWPPALVVPWWRAERRLHREWHALQHGQGALPWTASREEAWLWEQAGPSSTWPWLSYSVVSNDSAYAAGLRERLSGESHKVTQSSDDAVDPMLFDADPWGDARAAQLASVAGNSTIALTGWPTADLKKLLLAAGAHFVVSKD